MPSAFGSSDLFSLFHLPDISNAAHNDINGSFVVPWALFALAARLAANGVQSIPRIPKASSSTFSLQYFELVGLGNKHR
jgi:hypothetical protein